MHSWVISPRRAVSLTPELAVLADDLTGAAESAAQAFSRTTRVEVWLGAYQPTPGPAVPDVVCVDTDSRQARGRKAAARALRGTAGLRSAGLLVKKVDSLLRGDIGAEVAALAADLGVVPVVATALPAAGRTVVDGIPLVAGAPLRETDLWAAETGRAPARVGDVFAPRRARVVPQHVVAAGVTATVEALQAAIDAGAVPVCDSATDADLDVVARAATIAVERPLLVGSAALVGAATRLLPQRSTGAQTGPAEVPLADTVLVVIGSVAPALRAQLAALGELCDATVLLDPHELVADPEGAARTVRGRLTGARVALVALDQRAPVLSDRTDRICAALADAVAPLVPQYSALVAAGGQTARAVLDRMRVTCLHPVEEISPGAVLSRTAGTGQLVVTRPGSFGSDTSLHGVVERLLPRLPTASAKEIP